MSLSRSFYKRLNRFCLGRLKRLVAEGRMRPFAVDEEGVWYKTGYHFWIYSDLRTKILKLDSNPVWEESVSRLILDSVRDKVFFDIGANIGYFSVLAARAGAKAVYSFEPVPHTFAMLKKNIVRNQCEHCIRPIHCAVGGEPGTLSITVNLGPKNHLSYFCGTEKHPWKARQKIQVPVLRLDDFVKQEGISEIGILKSDTEGYDFQVLLGAEETLRRFRPVLIMEVNEIWLQKFRSSKNQLLEKIKELGYQQAAENIFLPNG